MKKLFFIAALISGISTAFAEDVQKPAEPQYHVQLVRLDTSIGAEVKIAPEDYPNGVFVRAKEVFGERPVTASIFAEKLRAKGFKIAENIESADAVIMLRSSEINFKEIEQDANSISSQKVDAAAGVVVAALATGGVSLLATDWSNFSNKKPVYTELSIFVEDQKTKKSAATNMNGAIKADASNAKVTRAFLDILTDEWLKVHLRSQAAVGGEASAPTATQSAVQATK